MVTSCPGATVAGGLHSNVWMCCQKVVTVEKVEVDLSSTMLSLAVVAPYPALLMRNREK